MTDFYHNYFNYHIYAMCYVAIGFLCSFPVFFGAVFHLVHLVLVVTRALLINSLAYKKNYKILLK